MEKNGFFISKEDMTYLSSELEIANCFEQEYDNNETPSVSYISLKYEHEIYLPITIFQNKLAPSQIIIKYLKEQLNLTNKKIALLLDKDPKTIWAAYDSIKNRKAMRVKETTIQIPLSAFKNSQFSALETLVQFLKKLDLTYAEIARLLNKDQRTIWTVYSRVRKKIEFEKHDAE